MPSPINGAPPTNAPAPPARAAAATSEVLLKLLQPLDGDLLPGENVRAQVLAVREQGPSFQLMLRVSLANGQQATVQATSNRPLETGATLNVVATASNTLLGNLQNAQRPQMRLDLQQLPPGSALRAQVETSSPQPAGSGAAYRLVVRLLDGPQAGTRLALDSAQPMAPGSQLTARVQNDRTLLMQPLATRVDQLEIGRQLASQQARQGSLETLLRGLQARLENTSGASHEAAALRSGIERLLAGLPDVKQMADPAGVARALQNSGVFLEPRLLQQDPNAAGQDLKAGLLRLFAQLAPNTNPAALAAALTQPQAQAALPGALRSALGMLGRDELRIGSARFPLNAREWADAEGEEDEGLLKLLVTALARLQTHQLSSLAQTQQTADGSLLTTWQLEIPVRDQRDLVPIQMRLQKEEEAPDRERRETPQVVWRLDLAFDLSPLGPLQVQAQVKREVFSSQFWAERKDTALLVDRELEYLRQRLNAAGFEVGELASHLGMPPRGPNTDLKQRWVDETA